MFRVVKGTGLKQKSVFSLVKFTFLSDYFRHVDPEIYYVEYYIHTIIYTLHSIFLHSIFL